MTAKRYFLPFLLAGALLAGCDDKKTEQPKVDTSKAATDMKMDAQKAADQAKAAASDAGKSATDAAKSASDATKAAAGNALDAVKANTTDAANATRTQAQEWMTKLEDAVKNNKLDEASTYLDKLQTMRASLPVEWQAKLDSIRTTYEAAKAKAAVPGLNK
ncbi:MAG: hypothetical protein JWN40_4808 [Phycisphaerales bacterium]|nr:hypothetical protein [Phycisphaerales bacterium]